MLLVLVDTLRTDHLHAYGYTRHTSDQIDELAATGWLFENHLASSAQTVPSTLSLMLSRHPAEHGFRHLGIGHFSRHRPQYPEAFLFLAEVFAEAGYATAGFMSNPFLQRQNGFAQGFDTFFYSNHSGDELTTAALTWLRQHQPLNQPFFLYLHYFDVHAPYLPPEAFRDRFPRPPEGHALHENGRIDDVRPEDLQASVALYDGEIAFVDAQIGALVAELATLGLRERTWIAVTSDHGEEFLDHGGLGHGTSVYGELIRVPLVLAGPNLPEPGRRIHRLTHHIDLAPTLLALAGLDRPPEFRGSALTGPAAEVSAPQFAFAEDGPWLAVHSPQQQLKLIVNRRTGAREIFDLGDKLDQQPLAPAACEPSDRARLLEQARWYTKLERLPHQSHAASPALHPTSKQAEESAPTHDWSPDERERLKALGYVDEAGEAEQGAADGLLPDPGSPILSR